MSLNNYSREMEPSGGKHPALDEEEEISPPDDLDEPIKEKTTDIKPQTRSHECQKCHKSFSKVSLLNRHMKLHSGIKPFQCNVGHTGLCQDRLIC